MSKEMQNIIMVQTINMIVVTYNKTYTEEDFTADFEKSENTFVNERYAFEITPRTSHNLQCSFLLALSRTLNILAKPLT